jgi:transposase-like protein
MANITYSAEQVKALSANPNVKKCSSKSITYSKDFKIRAVKAFYEGQSANAIFKLAGLDLAVIGKWKPRACLKAWRRIYKTHGEAGFARENRGRNGGRKPKDKQSADVEYLQAKVAYLEAENNFLRNLKTKNKT